MMDRQLPSAMTT